MTPAHHPSLEEVLNSTVDYAVAPTIIGAAYLAYIPSAAAAMAALWYAIRIWETDTVQKWWQGAGFIPKNKD